MEKPLEGHHKDADAIGLTLPDDMSGHPTMSRHTDAGYDAIIF